MLEWVFVNPFGDFAPQRIYRFLFFYDFLKWNRYIRPEELELAILDASRISSLNDYNSMRALLSQEQREDGLSETQALEIMVHGAGLYSGSG